MKKLCGLLLASLILLLYACQKEVSFENGDLISSEGSLQSDATGDCLPKEISGTYEAGVALVGSDNTLEVQVNVLKTGPYIIYTDTVNGYFFRGSGSFSATGINTVTLQGNGTPELDGIDNFTVQYGTSVCIIPVTVLPEGGGGPAEFTFAGAPNTCMDYGVNGDYIVATPLTASNSVLITLNVTVAGTYSISTATSNGMTFSGTGTVLDGTQVIQLFATGTPVAAGSTVIPITAGSTTCSFTIEVLATPAPESNYFPHTVESNWSYEYLEGGNVPNANDSLLYHSRGTITVAGNALNVFEMNDGSGFGDVAAYRKSGGDYYRYTDLAYWIGFDDSQLVEFIFLKDNQQLGTSWNTAAYTGTITDGSGTTQITVRMKFTIVQKDVDVTYAVAAGQVSHSNVIVVEERYETEVSSGVWQPLTSYARHYYAKDVGMVLDEYYDGSGNATPVYKESMRRYQIAP